MAILTTLPQEGGESKFYEIPDDKLQQYSIEKEELTEDKASSVLGGGGLSKDKAEGTSKHDGAPWTQCARMECR